MKAAFHLLSDIQEMLAAEHDVADIFIAGNGSVRFARPIVDGVRVDLRHEDLEGHVIEVTVWDRNMILTEATILDVFEGELVAEFVRSVVARMAVIA